MSSHPEQEKSGLACNYRLPTIPVRIAETELERSHDSTDIDNITFFIL